MPHPQRRRQPHSSSSSPSSGCNKNRWTTMMMNRTNVAWMVLFMAVWSLLNLHYTRRIDDAKLLIVEQQQHDHPEEPPDYTVVGPHYRADDRPPRQRPRLGAVAQGLGKQADEMVPPPQQQQQNKQPPQTTFVYFDGGAFRQPATPVTADHNNNNPHPHNAGVVDNNQAATAAAPELASHGITTPPPKPRRPMGDQNENGVTATAASNACEWGPHSQTACVAMLRQRLPLPLSRLLFFGDSNMHNIVREGGQLEQMLVDTPLAQCPDASCQVRTNEYCNRTYGVTSSLVPGGDAAWVRPDLTKGEGPIAHGYANWGCSDCSKCNSRFLECTAAAAAAAAGTAIEEPAEDHRRLCQIPHGGYVYTEFARDVVWQTAEFRTTQENTAVLLRDGSTLYPNTVCVMAAGLHDMDVVYNKGLLKSPMTAHLYGNVTTYIDNVRWWLSLFLDDVCQHVVWLSNAAPMSDNYTQTIGRTKEWNEAVRDVLVLRNNNNNNDEWRDSTTYIDLWASSETWPHSNNLHMDAAWNVHLTNLFVQLWFPTLQQEEAPPPPTPVTT